MRTLVRGDWVVGYREPTHTLIRNGVVVFEDDAIIHVGREFDGEVDREIDGKGKLVAPGFIDTHVHCGHQAMLRLITDVGRPDLFGQPFLEFTVPRKGTIMAGDPRYLKREQRNESGTSTWSDFTVVELLRNGITTFLEFGARAHVQESLVASIERFGTRGYLGAGYNIGRWVGGENGRLERVIDLEEGQVLFDEAVEFVKKFDGSAGGRAKGALSPNGVELCSPDQIRDTAEVAKDLGVPIAIHAAYNVMEFYDILREHMLTPIELLEKLGMLQLGPTVNIGHGNLVAEHPRLAYSGGRDIELMGHYGCSVSHCSVNLVRRARYLDHWKKYKDAGVNLCLGTDTTPRDMIMQMRTASYFGKVLARDLHAAPASDVFEAATLGGARSLGRGDLGRLAPGAKADIIMIDLTGRDGLRYGPVRDPIKSVVDNGIGDDVDTVIVDGRICMENRVIPDLDLDALRTAAQESGETMWKNWSDWDPMERTAEEMSPWSYPLEP
jgi:5-methylthioadenosine/S-adenosylhomocysteine deaminase